MADAREGKRRPRLLVVGDAGQATGFEKVLNGICSYLHASGTFDLTVRGIGYTEEGAVRQYPFLVKPAGETLEDPVGVTQFARWLSEDEPDEVLIIHDLWNQCHFLAHKPPQLPSVGYFPVDTPNMKWSYAVGVGAHSAAVTYTQFGARETAAGVRHALDLIYAHQPHDIAYRWAQVPEGLSVNFRLDRLARLQNVENWTVIPHGIDRIFEPKPRGWCRRQFGLPEDAFIVLNVNANQFRKRQDITIRAFKHLLEREPKALLVFHCAGGDRSGWDLLQLAQYYGVAHRVLCVHHHKPVLSEEELGWLYNTADVHINTGGGEGWGLCLGSNTLVATADGPREIRDVRVGDAVLTEKGIYEPVKATVSRNVQNWFEVDVAGHLPLEVTPEHPFLVVRGDLLKSPDLAATGRWTRVDQMQSGDWVALGHLAAEAELGLPTIDVAALLPDDWRVDSQTVWHPMGYSGKRDLSFAELQEACGETKKVCENAVKLMRGDLVYCSERSAEVVKYAAVNGYEPPEPRRYPRFITLDQELLYVIGWYLAEGSGDRNSLEFSMGADERGYAEEIASIIATRFGVEPRVTIEDGKSPGTKLRISVNGAPVAAFFAQLCGKGARNKRLHPTVPLQHPAVAAVWRGYLLGDGHRTSQGNTVASSVSRGLLHQMQLSLRAAGLRVSVRRAGRQDIYVAGIGAQDTARLFSLPFTRRATRSWATAGGHWWARVKAITPRQGVLEVCDLSIDGTHSFVAHNVLVHNTSIDSAQCGIPQLVPDWSATREIWKDAGVLLPIKDWRHEPKFLNTAHAIVDAELAGEALYSLALSPEVRQRLGADALARTMTLPDWTEVGKAFERVLVDAFAEGPAVPTTYAEMLEMRVGDVRSELQDKAAP